MKKTYQYIALAALALGFAACTQEDDFTPQGNQKGAPITIASVGVANLATRATIEDDKLVEGNIGVTITSTGNDDRYKGSNVRWYGSNGVWGLVENQKVVLYEGNGESQKIYAYYPYAKDIIEGTENLPVTLPEAFDSNFEGYDYLCTKEGISLSQNPVSLTLSHAFSKVSVSVNMMGNELEGDMVTEIALDNVPHNGERSATTGAIDPDKYGPANGRIALYGYDDEDYDEVADYYIGYALPNAATTLDLRVVMESGRIFTAKAPISGGMTDGVHYKIGLNVGKDKVEVSTVTIEPWGNGATLDDGVANENLPSIDGTEYSSLTELQVVVKDKLSQEGVTSVTIDGCLTDGMHAAIISAINEVKTEGAVTNGSLSAGSVTYTLHTSFADAVGVWTDGVTLTLLSSNASEYKNNVTIENKKIVLDLNGYKLSFNSTAIAQFKIEKNGELTIRDSRGGGEYRTYHFGILVYGTLNIEGGTLHNKVTLNGGDAIINMTGGTLYGYSASGQNDGVAGHGTFNMSGGTISAKYAVSTSEESFVNISGDAILIATQKLFFGGTETTTYTITGGIFSHDPSQWVNLNAYTVTENSDGTWSVTAKE